MILASVINSLNESIKLMIEEGTSHDALLIIDVIKDALENGEDMLSIFKKYGLSLSDDDSECYFIESIKTIVQLLKNETPVKNNYIVNPPTNREDYNWHVTDIYDTCVAKCFGFAGDIDGGKEFAYKIATALNK